MTSTRLPGKVLKPLMGKPMLWHQINRLKACPLIDEIVIATTENSTDDPIIDFGRKIQMRVVRGSEKDVLSRYNKAAKMTAAEIVVRITSDCPLIDPDIVGRVILHLRENPEKFDYVSNTVRRTYPRGLDTEVMWRDVFDRMVRMAQSEPAHEHVTWFIHQEQPSLFRLGNIVDNEDNSDLRWTVDTPQDFEMVKAVYETLHLDTHQVKYRDLVKFVRENPAIAAINSSIQQKTH